MAEIKKADSGSSGSLLSSAWNLSKGAFFTTVKAGLLVGVGLPVGFSAVHGATAGFAAGFDDYHSNPNHFVTSVGTGLAKAFDVGTTDLGIAFNFARHLAGGGLGAMDVISTTARDATKFTPSQP